MKITIVKIHRSDKSKDGKPFVNKDGDPYTRLGIQSKEYGSRWMSGFENKYNANWKEGDSVDVEVSENGEWLNFRTLSKNDLLEKRIEALEKAVFKN